MLVTAILSGVIVVINFSGIAIFFGCHVLFSQQGRFVNQVYSLADCLNLLRQVIVPVFKWTLDYKCVN